MNSFRIERAIFASVASVLLGRYEAPCAPSHRTALDVGLTFSDPVGLVGEHGGHCYYLAKGLENCNDACRSSGDLECDLVGLAVAAQDLDNCLQVVGSFGGFPPAWAHTRDWDLSGCTYGDWLIEGHRHVENIRREGLAPTCEEENADHNRHRICACKRREFVSYHHFPASCTQGNNIAMYKGFTVDECRESCEANLACKSFEFGVDYGGLSGYRPGDCQLQSYTDLTTCDGRHHNLDMYVRDPNAQERPDPFLKPCWDSYPQGKCCNNSRMEAVCFDSTFTRIECCGTGAARVSPGALADRPFIASSAGARPARSAKQRAWERSVANATRVMEASVFGLSLKLCVFKRSHPDLSHLIEDVARDNYMIASLIQAPPPSGSFILDLGANVGVLTIVLAKLFGPKGVRLVAVEAAPSNYRYLLWNLRVNGIESFVLPVNAAVGAAGAPPVDIRYSPRFPTGAPEQIETSDQILENFHGGGMDWHERTQMPTVSMEDLLSVFKIETVGFLKVDCEGCEWDVFDPVSWHVIAGRVQQVSAELHSIRKSDESRVEALKLLIPCRTFLSSESGWPHTCSTLG